MSLFTIHSPGVFIFKFENYKMRFMNTWVTEMSRFYHVAIQDHGTQNDSPGWEPSISTGGQCFIILLLMTIKQLEIISHSLHRPSVELHTHHTAIAVSRHTAGWHDGAQHGRTVAEDSTPQPGFLLSFVSFLKSLLKQTASLMEHTRQSHSPDGHLTC